MSADADATPFVEAEDSYSDEPMQDLSGKINLRLWQGPDTNIDDDDFDDDDLLTDDREQLSLGNLHDQRLEEEESVDISMDEKRLPPVRPPQRDLQPESNVADVPRNLDRLPDRPRRSQPIAGDSQSTKRRQPLPRNIAAQRPYNGIPAFCVSFL